MLDKTIPAVVLPILYPGSNTPVRFHRHIETGAIWVVPKDVVCPEYMLSKMCIKSCLCASRPYNKYWSKSHFKFAPKFFILRAYKREGGYYYVNHYLMYNIYLPSCFLIYV